MIRQIVLFILIIVSICVGCQNSKPASADNEAAKESKPAPKLQTHLALATTILTPDSVPLIFTVINNADSTQRFCKWETPFEPKLGKFFEIMDINGHEASFKGTMARRVMPPPAESYIVVPAHDSVQTTVNLATNYTIANASYTLRYSGGGVSGLEEGNEIKFVIVKP